jgi:hypothetical protein
MKKIFLRREAQETQKGFFLRFLPAPGVYECLRECGVRIFAANAFRFFFAP